MATRVPEFAETPRTTPQGVPTNPAPDAEAPEQLSTAAKNMAERKASESNTKATRVADAELMRLRKVQGRVNEAHEAYQRAEQAMTQAGRDLIAAQGQYNLVAEELRETYGPIHIDLDTGSIVRGMETKQG